MDLSMNEKKIYLYIKINNDNLLSIRIPKFQ